MSAAAPSSIAVIGLGLIGGSLGRAAARCGCSVRGFDRSPAEAALHHADFQLCDSVAEAVEGVDAAVVATPVLAMREIIHELRSATVDLAEPPLLTDTASTKDAVAGFVAEAWGTPPPNWVFSHPLAGSERSGFAASSGDLFRNAPVLISPTETSSDAAVSAVSGLWSRLGAVPHILDLSRHDSVLALTSHLPHLLAFALMRAVLREGGAEMLNYSAGGFRDFSRIASSDADVWADIAVCNAGNISRMLGRYGEVLEQLREALDAGDRESLRALFAEAARARDAHYDSESAA
ncbi:MAG: prephenate dehydrogenase/arogenate dehydrogenase family protein [Gammaproteobacteria bacterium AqS3]|nr:prephenate dehydrogenase/arogenate dehydrogenase family protein [Gammaproteobacteria bacterium AqS3]